MARAEGAYPDAAYGLPPPVGAVLCSGAQATSQGRIVGHCSQASGKPFAVVWASGDGAQPWSDVHVLLPLDGDEVGVAYAMSGDLVVGASARIVGNTLSTRPAAWRLPRRAGE